jgi:hypothetical protein
MAGTAASVSGRMYCKIGEKLDYPAAVEFNGRSILLVVGDQRARDSSYDGTWWYVSQSGP